MSIEIYLLRQGKKFIRSNVPEWCTGTALFHLDLRLKNIDKLIILVKMGYRINIEETGTDNSQRSKLPNSD